MKRTGFRLTPRTIRGQILAIIILAILLVIVMGRVLEVIGREAISVADLEVLSERAGAIALLMQPAPPGERETLLKAAERAGFQLQILPADTLKKISRSSGMRSRIDWLVESLFGDTPVLLGGRRILLDEGPVLTFDLDPETALILSLPDTVFTNDVLAPLTYYILSFTVLILLFSLFAVRVVTEPLKAMSKAVQAAEVGSDDRLFEERGAVEVAGLARALNEMRLRIREMIGARTRMLRSVSHDLRTPLTRLRLRSERVEDGILRTAMLSDIQRIDALINETLKYLRDDVSTETMQRADVASILQTICAEFSDVGFSVSYDGPDRCVGVCKPNALTRAVTNLCDNGVKFATNVALSLRAGERDLTIKVSDDGPGIAQEHRGQVLEPFFKVDTARNAASKSPGFGLGLSIVSDIVRGHGGQIEFASNEPHGLIVLISIPLLLPSTSAKRHGRI